LGTAKVARRAASVKFLAEMSGVTRSSVSVVAHILQQAGLIR
jgi:DNA-binding MarR family transcriptional regulator